MNRLFRYVLIQAFVGLYNLSAACNFVIDIKFDSVK